MPGNPKKFTYRFAKILGISKAFMIPAMDTLGSTRKVHLFKEILGDP